MRISERESRPRTGLPVRRTAFLLGLGTAFLALTRALIAGSPPARPPSEDARGTAKTAPATAPPPGKLKPNIVLILADDLGYGDLACYGSRTIPTPRIDSIGANGARFTAAYVTAPVCSPSRAGLLTGRYQQRFGYEFNTGPDRPAMRDTIGLPTNETTIAQVLTKAGYATGLVGKWHLGSAQKFHPLSRGFGEFFGFLMPSEGSTERVYMRNREVVQVSGSHTEAFTQESLAFIDRHRAGPFFLITSYNVPHGPLWAPSKYLGRFPQLSGNARTYAAMVSEMDDGVGAILDKLKSTGLSDRTLVVFMSDNGCQLSTNACSNGSLLGGKFFLQEGGIRIPWMMQWPGRIAPGTVGNDPVIALDLFPTFASVAGASTASLPLDGIDLVPYLTKRQASLPERSLFWRLGPNRAVRKGTWKLFEGGTTVTWLFDIAADPAESRNVAAAHPDVVTAMRRELNAWNAKLKPPLWPPQRGEVRAQVLGEWIDVPM